MRHKWQPQQAFIVPKRVEDITVDFLGYAHGIEILGYILGGDFPKTINLCDSNNEKIALYMGSITTLLNDFVQFYISLLITDANAKKTSSFAQTLLSIIMR